MGNITAAYVKKPIRVEAVQFTRDAKIEIYEWAKRIQRDIIHSWDKKGNPTIEIPTEHENIVVRLNDWIIVEPFPTEGRKLYCCREDIFEQTYEKIE